MKYLLRSFIMFIFSMSVVPCLMAQDFEVSPVRMRFDANPGENQLNQLNIINHSNRREKLVFSLSDYLIDETGNKRSAPAGTSSRSCANWITINPSFAELNPNESTTVEVLMNVPANGFETRWGVIHVQPAKEQLASAADKEMAAGVTIVPRIVVLVQQSPRSNKNYRGTIGNISEVTVEGDLHRTFQAVIQNTGDKILDAKVTLAVANIQTATERTSEPVKYTVYPGGIRVVELYFRDPLEPGRYAVAAMLDYGHNQPIEITQMLLEVKQAGL